MKLVTLDFETYYDKDYSLRKMNTIEYVTDERFKAHGVSIQVNDGSPLYFTGDAMASALRAALDEPCTLLCQNTKFDRLHSASPLWAIPNALCRHTLNGQGSFPL